MSLMSQFYNHPQKLLLNVFANNTTYTPTFDAWHWFAVVGGGGSGGAVSTLAAGHWGIASGGNGANVRYGWVFLRSSQSYTVTIGAGGLAITSTTNTATPGNDGASSTLSGGDLDASIVGTGGKGGLAFRSSYTNDYSTSNYTMENTANAAGSGVGADSVGGLGGRVVLDASMVVGARVNAATGGGACNVKRYASALVRGGDILVDVNTTGVLEVWASTGGGGTGGIGGDIIGQGNGSSAGSSGGGSADAGLAQYTTVRVLGGVGSGTLDYLEPGGIGGACHYSPTEALINATPCAGGDGGGGGNWFPTPEGTYNNTVSGVTPFGAGGRWGGGSGMCNQDAKGAYSGGPNGGGGGAYSGSGNASSGAGGKGVIVLQAFISPRV